MAKKQTGLIPDAHPTAPGGMSQEALAYELIDKHGWKPEDLGDWVDGKNYRLDAWAEMIDAVVLARQAAEVRAEDIKDLYDGISDLLPGGLEMPAELAKAINKGGPAPLFIGMPDTKDYIFDGHAGAGPSASERWINCTASLGASRAFLESLTPNQQAEFAGASTAARQGTTAHAAAEVKANHLLGRVQDDELDRTLLHLAVEPLDGEEYDDEMSDYITEYLDLLESYARERGPENVQIEQRVTATVPLLTADDYHEITGSADAVVLPTPEDPVLVVADLKYGNGIDVEVEDNSQAKIYALGAIEALLDEEGYLTVDIDRVDLHIVQPRLGGIKTWSISVDDLYQWQEEVLTRALTEALAGAKGGAAFTPGDVQCQWCPARGTCAALALDRMSQAQDLFDVIADEEFKTGEVDAFPETGLMDSAQLGSLYLQITRLTKIQKDLKEEVQRRLHRGQEVPGFDLRNYQPPRKWVDGAEDKLRPKSETDTKNILWVTEPKMVSPTVAEKLLTVEQFAKVSRLIEKPEQKPVVSSGPNDKRSKWKGLPPEAMFNNEEGEA